jgi:DUF4097 and DUF4098 domain-containing protein YvlB
MADWTRFNAIPRVLVLASAITGPACVIVSAGRYVEREDKQFAVTGKPHLELSTFDGSIEIRSSQRRDVAVTIEKQAYSKHAADRIEIHTEQTGDHIVVNVRLPRAEHVLGFANGASAKLIVSVPASADVQARSGDGSIDIAHVTGAIDLRSGDGSIVGRQIGGDVKAHTGDGSIELEQLDGALDVDTGDGSVKVSGKLTSVRARSGSGTVTVRAAVGSSAMGDWDIKTGAGSVLLEVPEGFSGELDAHTGDGSIRMHDLTLSNVTGQLNKGTVRGRLGDGGHAVRVRTGDGSITLRRS